MVTHGDDTGPLVGPEIQFVLSTAGPLFQLPFALATLREGLAIFTTKTAPASGLPFTSTFSNCLTVRRARRGEALRMVPRRGGGGGLVYYNVMTVTSTLSSAPCRGVLVHCHAVVPVWLPDVDAVGDLGQPPWLASRDRDHAGFRAAHRPVDAADVPSDGHAGVDSAVRAPARTRALPPHRVPFLSPNRLCPQCLIANRTPNKRSPVPVWSRSGVSWSRRRLRR